MLCIRGSNYQALIRDMLVFQQSLTKSLPNLWFLKYFFYCSPFIKSMYFFKHYIHVHIHIFGKFCHFLCKSVLGATLLRVFGEILFISPQKSYVLCVIFVFY